eukprot:9872670-Lingulodinium_polyedra.AAC.1
MAIARTMGKDIMFPLKSCVSVSPASRRSWALTVGKPCMAKASRPNRRRGPTGDSIQRIWRGSCVGATCLSPA